MRTTGATRRSPAASSTTATGFPSSYKGSYFFADYTQNWIKRLTFGTDGKVNGVAELQACRRPITTGPTATSSTWWKGQPGGVALCS